MTLYTYFEYGRNNLITNSTILIIILYINWFNMQSPAATIRCDLVCPYVIKWLNCESMRSSRNVRLCITNKRLDLKEPILHADACRQGTLPSPFSSKSSTFLTFLLKLKDLNRVHCEFRMNIPNTVPDRTNIAIDKTGNRRWPFDFNIYILLWLILKVKVKMMHISIMNTSQTMTNRSTIIIANTEFFACSLSIDLFAFDVGPY